MGKSRIDKSFFNYKSVFVIYVCLRGCLMAASDFLSIMALALMFYSCGINATAIIDNPQILYFGIKFTYKFATKMY